MELGKREYDEKLEEYTTYTRLLRRDTPSRYGCIWELTRAVDADTDISEWDEEDKNHLIIEAIYEVFG